jgi:hypothetical protein
MCVLVPKFAKYFPVLPKLGATRRLPACRHLVLAGRFVAASSSKVPCSRGQTHFWPISARTDAVAVVQLEPIASSLAVSAFVSAFQLALVEPYEP